jgi:hypothetical protein
MQTAFSALVCTLLLTTITTAQPTADRHCSLANTAGKWGFSINGSIPVIGPVGAVGMFTQDAAGNISGTETRSRSQLDGERALRQ